MSYFIRIFCRGPGAITRAELADFILDGSYFDTDPGFEPPPGSSESVWNRTGTPSGSTMLQGGVP
jgi:hypothetical protein